MYSFPFTFRALHGCLLALSLLGTLPAGAQYLGGFGDGSFTAAAVSAVAPLNLLTFTAEADQSVTHLHWETTQEEATDYFEIQRATTATGPFVVVGRTDAAGYSRPGEVLAYRFTDAAPPTGRAYYRLRVVDLDGTFRYGTLASVDRVADLARFEVFPNPADGTAIQLRLSEVPVDRSLHVEVLDATGRHPVATQTVALRGDVAKLNFTDRLPAGSYLLRLHTGRQTLPTQLLIVAD